MDEHDPGAKSCTDIRRESWDDSEIDAQGILGAPEDFDQTVFFGPYFAVGGKDGFGFELRPKVDTQCQS